MEPSPDELDKLRLVLNCIVQDIRSETVIRLPRTEFPSSSPDLYALTGFPIPQNQYGGTVGELQYQFEGEDDLLHLFVTRSDRAAVSTEDGQRVADLVLRGVPKGVIWFKPGEYSQHFYIGHEALLQAVESSNDN